ncbi:MAG: AmpD protein [Colwellia sp.]|jgi:AmpD protein|uniref:1,6-anhydro-N-acetylmuramyl-L-alanine amidase AmpD n=1 Tax=Colwellia sp. BRX8-7 TaxID=2759833 RepID=UPI0021752E8E|nr:1,6-anhydro-N-acetylmuramyl-L-alanine amidase AmpD [Colwellia sp. BRX8-7]
MTKDLKNKLSTKQNNNMPIISGWLVNEEQQKSPHFSVRDKNDTVHLLVVHNISLPPNQFGGCYITDFFLGKLDSKAHCYFEEIAQLKVSAHCLITRVGHIIQYVSFNDKAWHAGVSSYQGLDKCNDFSIGIELEGADDIPYEAAQYHTLAQLTQALQQCYPDIKSNIAGHSDIAPGRKTDPGDAFNWQHFHDCLKSS